MLWRPAAATSKARRPRRWPRTSRISGSGRSLGSRATSVMTEAGSGAIRCSSTPTTSASDRTIPVSSPGTMAVSGAASGGARRRIPCRRATSAIGRTPQVDWIVPSRDNSPSSSRSAYSRRDRRPLAASTPTAIGRSNDVPRLRTSAGARLIVTRWAGNSKPEFRIALRTRSRLSRTLESGSPTILKAGSPKDTSTSTLTSDASIPNREAERRRASTSGLPQGSDQDGEIWFSRLRRVDSSECRTWSRNLRAHPRAEWAAFAS